ncbi:hypothetical protein JCM33374_g623 [Metschnikowia sp. JCM 33374]|nr:hypothetical protein JCM33374_g623 [Metschnikowia sp. JCM 33374]
MKYKLIDHKCDYCFGSIEASPDELESSEPPISASTTEEIETAIQTIGETQPPIKSSSKTKTRKSLEPQDKNREDLQAIQNIIEDSGGIPLVSSSDSSEASSATQSQPQTPIARDNSEGYKDFGISIKSNWEFLLVYNEDGNIQSSKIINNIWEFSPQEKEERSRYSGKIRGSIWDPRPLPPNDTISCSFMPFGTGSEGEVSTKKPVQDDEDEDEDGREMSAILSSIMALSLSENSDVSSLSIYEPLVPDEIIPEFELSYNKYIDPTEPIQIMLENMAINTTSNSSKIFFGAGGSTEDGETNEAIVIDHSHTNISQEVSESKASKNAPIEDQTLLCRLRYAKATVNLFEDQNQGPDSKTSDQKNIRIFGKDTRFSFPVLIKSNSLYSPASEEEVPRKQIPQPHIPGTDPSRDTVRIPRTESKSKMSRKRRYEPAEEIPTRKVPKNKAGHSGIAFGKHPGYVSSMHLPVPIAGGANAVEVNRNIIAKPWAEALATIKVLGKENPKKAKGPEKVSADTVEEPPQKNVEKTTSTDTSTIPPVDIAITTSAPKKATKKRLGLFGAKKHNHSPEIDKDGFQKVRGRRYKPLVKVPRKWNKSFSKKKTQEKKFVTKSTSSKSAWSTKFKKTVADESSLEV